MSYGSFDTEFKRSMNGTKATLKALINKLGGSVSEEKIDENPNLVEGIEIAGNASDITYDNKDSGLVATDVQSAIDEVYSIQKETTPENIVLHDDSEIGEPFIADADTLGGHPVSYFADARLSNLESTETALKNLGAEKAGSAAVVQEKLDAHIGDKNNPHGMTAQQIGALPVNMNTLTQDLNTLLTPGVYSAVYDSGVNQTDYHTPYGETQSGYSTVTHYNIFVFGLATRLTQVCSSAFSHNRGYWWRTLHDSTWSPWYKLPDSSHTHDAAQITSGVLPYERGGTGVASLAQLVMNMFPAKKYEMPSTSYNFAILGPGWSDNGHLDLPTLASLLGVNGALRYQTGTYRGTGESTNVLELPVAPKVLIIMIQPKSDWTESVQIPLVAICPGHYLTQTTNSPSAGMDHLEVVDFGTTVKIKSGYDFVSYNDSGDTYTWVALY